MIFLLLLVVALISAWRIYAMPDLYRAEVLITPVGEQNRRVGRKFRHIVGIANLAGVSMGVGRSSSRVNLVVLKSRTFLEAFVKEHKLKTILFAKQWDEENKSWRKNEPRQVMVYRKMKRAVKVSTNKKTGLITIAVTWTDSKLAAAWANGLVASLNNYLQQQALQQSKQRLGYLNDELAKTRVAEVRHALFDLISHEQRKDVMISSQKQFAFRVVDLAVAPDKKSRSKRRILFIVIKLSILIGFLAAVCTIGYYLGRRSVR